MSGPLRRATAHRTPAGPLSVTCRCWRRVRGRSRRLGAIGRGREPPPGDASLESASGPASPGRPCAGGLSRISRRYPPIESGQKRRTRRPASLRSRHFANENIPVVLLKGAISLTQDLYPEPGMRMMSDLDLLVPHAEAARAFALLQAAGFRSWRDTTRRALPENHHHLPELVNETLVAAQVELHTEPVARRCGGTLPAEQVFADAVAYRWRDRDILIPSLAHRILHNVLHSQLADGDFRARRINLRHLHEFDRLLQCGDAASLAQTIGRSLPRHQFPIWDAHTALHRVLFLAEPLALHPGAGGFMRRARLHSRLPFGFAAARIGATWLDSARHLLQRPGLHLPKLVDAGWYARRWQSLKNQWQERR